MSTVTSRCEKQVIEMDETRLKTLHGSLAN